MDLIGHRRKFFEPVSSGQGGTPALIGTTAGTTPKIVKSLDYGDTWSDVCTPSNLPDDCERIRCSFDLQSIMFLSNIYSYLSTDGGSSFSQAGGVSAISFDISSSGQYIVVAYDAYSLDYSDDYGSTWDTYDLQSILLTSIKDVAISNDGQYIFVVSSTGTDEQLLVSDDGGLSWDEPTTAGDYYLRVSCSDNGEYCHIGGDGIVRSDDYGATLSQESASSGEAGIACSKNGQYILTIGTYYGRAYYSTDYGDNYSEAGNFYRKSKTAATVSGDGQYMYVLEAGYFGDTLHRSTDYGSTWGTATLPTDDLATIYFAK